MKTFPNTVVGLLEELEARYPPRCRASTETERDHERYAGKVELIAKLRERFEADAKREKGLPTVF